LPWLKNGLWKRFKSKASPRVLRLRAQIEDRRMAVVVLAAYRTPKDGLKSMGLAGFESLEVHIL
jgi:hypothetical protein